MTLTLYRTPRTARLYRIIAHRNIKLARVFNKNEILLPGRSGLGAPVGVAREYTYTHFCKFRVVLRRWKGASEIPKSAATTMC
ncbi:hypothetical protein E2C01_091310 [Portunus trituberculatus]|uniref:Uncharacterized protein n=1 Tax=Portunus trituberculatus TaxID=210409 RepID=A0A5B7JNP7_PORTR|nr:hypothetical protein [Portunus trituberculatus]